MSTKYMNRLTANYSNRNQHDDSLIVTDETTESTKDLLKVIMQSANAYVFPREDRVPAGLYFSEIVSITPRKKSVNGKPAKLMLDVCYDIEGYDYNNKGQMYKIKQSYVVGSPHIQDFFDAMTEAGVDYTSDANNLIGTQERIKLAYTSARSDIGSIDARVPYYEPDDDGGDDEVEVEDSE